MSPPRVDRDAARALLVARGLNTFAAEHFLMRSLLTATEAATVLGVKDSRAARDTLRRWGVKPVGRGAGRTGENTYPAELVWQHYQNRPGRGWRKGQSAPTTGEKDNAMKTSPYSVPFSDVEPWYANHDDVVVFASVLVDAHWLSTPHDVVEFFTAPWEWSDQWMVWALAGRPHPPSPDDRAQIRTLAGRGTLSSELERRYRDDTARWQEFIESLEVAGVAGVAGVEEHPSATPTDMNVLPLTTPRRKAPKTPDNHGDS